jgi:hypothetical protein
MSKNSEAVKKWRHKCKLRIVESMGGKCQCCGYDKCTQALDLHHLDPTEKEMGLGGIRANPKSWESIVQELRKCVLLCNRCHQEVHAGVTPAYQLMFKSLMRTMQITKNLIIKAHVRCVER